VKVGGNDDGILLIITACMAQYCNYWHKRKSPIDGNIIAGISRRVGGQRGGVDYIMDGVEGEYYDTLLNNQLFVESGWNMGHKQ
jgi:hypothetical protein